MSRVRKTFFLVYDVTIYGTLQISLISTDILTKREKALPILFHFSFFFYMKGGNLKAASLACISNFVGEKGCRNDLNVQKIEQLNHQKLGLKRKTN